MRKRFGKLTALLLALTLALTACVDRSDGEEPPVTDDGPPEPFTLTVRVSGIQTTLDPARSTAAGCKTILYHLFENLLRWEDDGNGWAVLAPGQAESWEEEKDYAGNATYTFTLREGLTWSDGKPVTAADFVTAWRRLADPANALPHRELMEVVAGYDQVQEEGDPTLLGVSAPDERTFVVSLNGSCAYFLAELCAGAHTMPVRADLAERTGWGSNAAATVTNGAYTVSRISASLVTLERSKTYYDHKAVRPERLQFVTSKSAEEDYGSFLNGELDLISSLTAEGLEALAAEEYWTPDPVTSVYGVLLNTQQPPFDDANIRLAFRLAIDSQAVVDAVGNLTVRPAVGLIPYGVADYGQRPETPEEPEPEPTLPDPNAAPTPEAPPEPYWDFRIHSLQQVTVSTERDYAADCLRAQALMAQAGYAGGGGFPVVEYIYVDSDMGRAVARALQSMWRTQLGVTVTVRALSQEEYDAMLLPTEEEDGESSRTTGAYAMAGQSFSAGYGDAFTLLSLWHSGNSLTGYVSANYDILMDSARTAMSAEARDAFLHDAEAILLDDAPVIPVCYAGSGYLLAEGLTGLYRGPDGVYFLSGVRETA